MGYNPSNLFVYTANKAFSPNSSIPFFMLYLDEFNVLKKVLTPCRKGPFIHPVIELLLYSGYRQAWMLNTHFVTTVKQPLSLPAPNETKGDNLELSK